MRDQSCLEGSQAKDCIEVSVFAIGNSERRRLFQTDLSDHAASDHRDYRGCSFKTYTGSVARLTDTTFGFASNGRVSKKMGGRKEVGTSLKKVWTPSLNSSDLPYSRAFTIRSLGVLPCDSRFWTCSHWQKWVRAWLLIDDRSTKTGKEAWPHRHENYFAFARHVFPGFYR